MAFSAYYKYKISVDMMYDKATLIKCRKEMSVFLRIKVSLISHFNKPILESLLVEFFIPPNFECLPFFFLKIK